MNLLGAPILEGKAVNKALQAKIKDLERSVERLSLLQAHDDLYLLKNALAMPKLQYILRTSPCAGNPLLSALDDVLRQAYPRSSTSTFMILSGHKHFCLSRWAD